MNTRIVFSFIGICLILSGYHACGQSSLESVSSEDGTAIDSLITQLGDADFLVREDAQKQLLKLGIAAQGNLQKALSQNDLEIHRRVVYLLQSIPQTWEQESDSPELKSFLIHYRRGGVLSRISLLDVLNRLPFDLRFSALDRIINREQEDSSAWLAAISVWYYRPTDNSLTEFERKLRVLLDRQEKKDDLAVKTLRFLVDYPAVREDANTWFDQQYANKDRLFQGRPKSSMIARYIATILTEYARRETEAALTPDQLAGASKIEFTPITWGQNSKTTVKVGDISSRYSRSDRQIIPILISLGRENEFAAQDQFLSSLAYIPLYGPLCLLHRDNTSAASDWIVWETSGGTGSINSQILFRMFAETLHDHDYDQLAAAILSKADSRKMKDDDKSRIQLFKACNAQKEGKTEAQWEYVQKALRLDSTEEDSIIMQWELCQIPPDKLDFEGITDEIRKKQEEALDARLLEIEKLIRSDEYGNDKYYNQYAWLAVKTNRNLDKALNNGLSAVENNPQSSACLDTLAHVYVAQGEFDKAIDLQKQALELDPASYSLYKNLQNFIKLKDSHNSANENKPNSDTSTLH